MIRITYVYLQENLDAILDSIEHSGATIVVEREGHADIVLTTARELSALDETYYLLNSPRNAERLLNALHNAKKGNQSPQSLDALRKEMGLSE